MFNIDPNLQFILPILYVFHIACIADVTNQIFTPATVLHDANKIIKVKFSTTLSLFLSLWLM